MDCKAYQGFTLIELLVAVAVAGILLSVGVPSFAEAIRESRISSQYNKMVGSLFLARSEAVKGPDQITLCPRKSIGENKCGTSSDWANGWIVFIDNTIVAGESQATIDDTDEIIKVESALNGDNTIIAIGSSSSSAMNAELAAFVRYTTDGNTDWASGSMVVCDAERGPESSRSINIVLTGDIRRGRVSSGSSSPRDVFNQPISKYCPDSN